MPVLRTATKVVLALIVLFALWVVSTGARWRGGVEIADAFNDGNRQIDLVVDSCDGNPRLSSVRRAADRAEVGVVANWGSLFFGGGDCQDILTIPLDRPLGDRDLFDERTGKRVTVYDVAANGE